jgi:adenine deaminase
MKNQLSSEIHSINSVAMGDKPADLILKNCSLVNVYTKEILKKTEIAISKERIAFVGTDASHTAGPRTVIIDLEGKYVTPGFADPHIHIDQFILPSELAKKSLLCGVTSLFSDPIDIVSVCGFRGFREFTKLTSKLPIRIFHVVPGGLPVDRKFSHGRTLSALEEKSAIKLPNVVGLGEVFSWTKVTSRDPKTMKTLQTMLDNGCIINGHTAGASGKKLNAYVSSGILSCHEPINFEQTLERLRLGMWIMIREGSIRRDLKEILTQVMSHGTYTNHLMFCSDGVDPIDLKKYGHIDHCVREAINLGLDPVDAITMASKNCFDYYKMGQDLGGIAPGKIADILVFNSLTTMKPSKVFVGGKLVVSNGSVLCKIKKKSLPKWITETVKLKKFSAEDFSIKSKSNSVTANLISMQTEIITKKDETELFTKDGNVQASTEKDVWKVAVFDRTFGSKKHTVGFLKNFGSQIGAFASTWSFHENDLIIIGSNEEDMKIAANNLIKSQGGMTVIKNGETISIFPLKVAGIISTDSFDKVSDNFEEINSTIVDSGCKFQKPHLIPLFLPFLALPAIRILFSGIVDVKNRSYIPSIK